MRLLDDIPPAIADCRAIGGVLDVARFADTDGTDADHRAAVAAALRHAQDDLGFPAGTWTRGPDEARLATWPARRLTLEEFLGPGADPRSRALLHFGRYAMSDGQVLLDPSYERLHRLNAAGVTVRSGGADARPDWGLALAFKSPPYGLRADGRRIGEVFTALCATILPPTEEWMIQDWAGDDLTQLSEYFDAGAEWWGTYLYTIHLPASRSLTVVSASTTD